MYAEQEIETISIGGVFQEVYGASRRYPDRMYMPTRRCMLNMRCVLN